MDINADATIPAAWRMLDDPREWADFSRPVPGSRQGVYTWMFFVFWGFTMMSSGLTALLSMPPWEVNQEPRADP